MEQHTRYPDGTLGQVDGQRSPRYAGLTTFARLPQRHEVEDFDVAVVGVPFDSGVTYRPGARFGPSAIRQASRLLRPYNPAQVSSGSQPDFYMMFLDGSTRLMPSWEIRLWGYDLPPLFWPTVVLPGP